MKAQQSDSTKIDFAAAQGIFNGVNETARPHFCRSIGPAALKALAETNAPFLVAQFGSVTVTACATDPDGALLIIQDPKRGASIEFSAARDGKKTQADLISYDGQPIHATNMVGLAALQLDNAKVRGESLFHVPQDRPVLAS